MTGLHLLPVCSNIHDARFSFRSVVWALALNRSDECSGLPHYGHILAGTIKDTVTRYAHQTGHYVSRRFGWDTHGLPIEYEIDKKLGVKTSQDVEKMGIKAYNQECRDIVMRYAGEWETVITRMGRWIDFRNDYKTLDPGFMESVWWVFKQLHEKGPSVMAHHLCTCCCDAYDLGTLIMCRLGVRRLQGDALLMGLPHPAQQLRGWQQLQGCHGPCRHRKYRVMCAVAVSACVLKCEHVFAGHVPCRE